MKKIRRFKKERGAIAVMTAVMLTVLLMFTALSIDIGLHHYLGAKLQNAADAAATAVGQKIDANEYNLSKCAYEYLAKNGYDNNGKYKDKIKVDVDIKGVVNDEFYEATSESEDYIDYCLVKVTVDVDDSTLFANAMGISSLHLKKVSYVVVKPNYESMPEALRYSIFAGAEMGDKDTSSDDANAVISEDNPAMDIQGSTGAGSRETAFSSVVAVAENTINGVNTFIQDFKGWINHAFGTSFDQDYNDLVSINVSEAVMNNDAHSNGNILIGVQALNAARSKDNDFTGSVAGDSNNQEYIQNEDERYSARTDADDYGTVHFTAVDTIDFNYSNYAKQRQTGWLGSALNRYLNNQPNLTRVYVQNQQNVQVQQHVINILNEMDLDDYASQSDFINGGGENKPGYIKAAERYFKENNAVSTQIINKVNAQKDNLVFDKYNRTVTLNDQESIVYRVNHKVSDEYLDAYASLDVDTSNVQNARKSRLAILTDELSSNGYDKMYKNNNQASGYVYANLADTDGGNLGESQTENVVLERYELNGKSVPKGTKNSTLKYTYNFKVDGSKVNRHMAKIDENHSVSTADDRAATKTGARYAITRTFQEKSDYIDMPNLAPFFTRQINKSIRAATKKRGQFNDGVTKGSRNVQVAVQQAQTDLDGVMEDVTYTDDTYSDSTKYNSDYAKKTLFRDYKVSSDTGLTKLTTTEQNLGGVNMSTTKYKGFDLYNSDGTLRTAHDFVEQYDTWNKNNAWFGHNKVNAVAEGMKFQNKNGTQEKNAVAEKKKEIKKAYADDGDSDNNSYRAEKDKVNNTITLVDKYNIEDITGEGGAYSVSEKVLATPTNPLATIDDNNGIFFKSISSKLFGTDSAPNSITFEDKLNGNQVSASTLPSAVTDSEVNIPVNIDSPYEAASITSAETVPSISYGGSSSFSIPGAPSAPSTSGMSNGGGISGNWGGANKKNPWTLPNNTYYSSISNHKSKSGWFNSWEDTSCIVGSGNTNVVTGDITMSNGKSVDNNGTLKVGGNVTFTGGGSHLTFGNNTNTEVVGYIDINTTASNDERKVKDGSTLKVGKYLRQVGNNGAIIVGSGSTLNVSGTEKYNQGTIDSGDPNFSCAVVANGNIDVYGTFKANGDVVSTAGSTDVLVRSNATMYVNGHLKVRRNLTVDSGAVLYVSGNIIAWENITNNGTIICGGSVITRSGSLTNNSTLNALNYDITSNITNSSTLTACEGTIYAGGTITNNSGATLRANGDITANGSSSNTGITNNGTLECGGTLKAASGDLKNYSTIKAGYIRVGDSTERWMFNEKTINVVHDVYVNGRYHNNNDKKNIGTVIRVGGSLTTNGNLYNYPGTSYTANSNSNPDAVIRVNGNISVGGTIDNNYSNNPQGSRGFIYVGGRLSSTGKLTNYEKSNVYGDGEIAPGSIDNKANSQIVTDGSINTGDIDNSAGGWISAKTSLSAAAITNYAQIYSGGLLKATGAVSSKSSAAFRAAGDFDFSSTVTIEHSIFTCGGAVKGSGSITCINLIARDGITANSISFSGSVKTDGDVKLSSSLTVASTATLTIADGNLNVGAITNNNSIIVNGNITSSSGLVTNYKDIFCYGNMTVSGTFLNGTTSNRAAVLKCKGVLKVSGYLENYGNMYIGYVRSSTVPSTVVLNVTGVSSDTVDSGTRRRSIRNFGNILTGGSIKSNSVLYSYGGGIYVYGDINTCNDGVSTDNGNNLLELKGSTKVFVHGIVTSSDSGSKRLWMYDVSGNDASSGTVLSIFGFGKGGNDCFGNKLEALVNQQKGSTIYLNSKLYLSGTGSDSSSELQNAGRLYVNGEINCPNLVSAWLTGSYDYGKTLAEDYVQGTYTSETPKYSGLTYCQGCFDAPKATVNVGDKHFVFVEDALTENFDGTGTLNQNINVKKVSMWGESMFYAPNQADISETVDVSGTAIFNVQNQVNAQGTNIADGSGGQIVAPVEVEITDGEDANLTGLSNVVFERDITTSSLRGTRVEIKIIGDLVVNGPINLTRSKLIVTGVIRCKSMTLAASMVSCGSTLTVANGSVGGALTMTNGSRMNVESNLVNVGAIDFNNGGMFVKGEISTASSIKLANGSGLITRNTERGNEGNHRNNINLGGTTVVESGSKLFVDGKLNTTEVTVNGASTLYAYTGIYFTNIANISIDITNHGEKNSEVFLGESNTRDDIQYNLYVDGTLYLPNKHYGRYTNMYTHVDIRNNGIVVCNGDITTDWIQVGSDSGASGKALLFVAGRTTLKNNCSYTSFGRTWAYGGTDLGAARTGGKNDPNFPLKDGGEIYMGEIYSNGAKTGVWNYGYYEGHGDVYIDGNLNVTNYSDNSNNKVGNRGTAMYIMSGMTYVSGNVTLCNDNAYRSMEGAGLVCQKDFKIGCTIWNFGKLHIYGAFTMDNSATWITDNSDANKNPAKGWSLRNGWEEGRTDASFIAYNYGNSGPLMTFKGYVKNAGRIAMNYGLSVEGYCTEDGMRKDYAFVNWAGADAQFAGEFRCNSNRFFNKWNTSFGCDGRFTYAEIAYNCGQMYVGGDLIDGYDSSFSIRGADDYRDNEVGWFNINGSPSRSFSFMNGLYKITADTTNRTSEFTWPEASLFVGGNMQMGNYESEKKAGTVINIGNMYTRGYLKVYSWGGNETTDTGPAFYQTSLMAVNNSNTFVGGECYSGSAAVTGKNTIFMCDGDLRVRRPLKVNMWFKYYNNGGTAGDVISYFEDGQYKNKGWLGSGDDGFRSCYMRVGGSIYANVEGRDLENFLFTTLAGDVVPYDHSRDIDIQANANIVIGGGFYCPQKLYLKQNVKMIICNQNDGLYDSNGNLNWKARGLDELASASDKNNPAVYGPGVTDTLTRNVNNILDWIQNKRAGEECALFAYQLLDMNICSTLVVNGNAYVRDTCKIRDMTKTYVEGDFIARDYLEVGKSLSEGSADATEARLDKYKETGENDTDYVFSNAGYMYVKGNLTSKKYTKIYASTTVRVGGNMEAGDWTQILGNPYITLRHDARAFVGGNMRAYSSIDSGAYSEMYVGGNVTAYTQNIKLRDQMTCYIGGDIAAATYLELGKYDDQFYRGVKSKRVQRYLSEAQDARERADEQGTVTDGGEFGYNGDEHERKDNETSSEAGTSDNQDEHDITTDTNQQFVNTDSELEKDDSDLAVGSEYYIGGNIVSFTKYIQEYAYSRIVSGGYVVSPQHITLRHNADMWVLPEVFNKTTYHTTEFEYKDGWDNDLWSKFKTQIQKAAHDIKEDFEPKAGSVYSLGQLTLNKNTSLMGTYDTMVFGQTVLRKSSLVFMGHDFDCWAPSYNIQSD
ncbi:MAG: hypothetical protein IJ872_03700, partial [Eubacterium sp.]|nr:hypothetical protein [Eubacterium sp.]